MLLLILGLVPSETRFCSKALCGLSSIQHCKIVALRVGGVGCVGFKSVCSSSEFLALYKAGSFFGASSIPLACCSLLSMEKNIYKFILVHICILFITGLTSIFYYYLEAFMKLMSTYTDYEHSTAPFLTLPLAQTLLSYCDAISIVVS